MRADSVSRGRPGYAHPPVRALVVTNLYPSPERPRLGRFVRDQVEALGDLGIEVSIFTFPLGARAYVGATRRLRRLLRGERFDIVHAHYGLCGWCARLAGADPLVVTFHGTDVRHRVVGPMSRLLAGRIQLAAGASSSLFFEEDGRRGLPRRAGATAALPCGADLARFAPAPRSEARRRLGLDRVGRYLLFPADPARAVKRHDRAAEVARRCGAELLTAGEIDPERMPDWINAAAAVLIPSDREGFGLVAVEALACRVPVLATPVGAARAVIEGVQGCLVEPFDAERWAEVAGGHVDDPDPRTPGSGGAAAFGAEAMAQRVVIAYREVLSQVLSQARPASR